MDQVLESGYRPSLPVVYSRIKYGFRVDLIDCEMRLQDLGMAWVCSRGSGQTQGASQARLAKVQI